MRVSRADMTIYGMRPALVLTMKQEDIQAWLKKYANRLPLDFEIKAIRYPRSRDANAYMWVLCDKIAAEVGITKEEVYREHIHNVGVFADIAIQTDRSDAFIEAFESNGTGWIAERQMDCKLPNCDKIRCYYGSSTYDSKQMSRLIDSVIDTAKDLDIETLPPDELERMKEAWE